MNPIDQPIDRGVDVLLTGTDTPFRGETCRGLAVLRLFALIGCVASFWPYDAVAGKTVVLSTLEWPPFASSRLHDFGATGRIITEAFAARGYEVRFSFNPWPVSVDMARTGADHVVAYFPGYHCRHRENFLESDPVGSSPLGFAERVDAPISWRTLDDLGEQQLKIGTVFGYTNTEEFDRRVGIGWIRAIPSENDADNLRRLLRGRIDAAVIDKHVFRYLVATEERLAQAVDELQFNDHPITEARFYVCFYGDAEGVSMRDVFNAGLATLDIDKRLAEYMNNLAVDVRTLPNERDPNR
ncbi:MAG: ABC transporter [Proteobacteria bacterium]|nr:MAG: ABC transporter [Pseudomonadota bacterium]